MHFRKGRLPALLMAATTIFAAFSLLFSGCANQTNIDTLDTFKTDAATGLYTLDYQGDYAFDEFLEVGAADDDELAAFMTEKLLDGTDIEIKAPGAGCTTFSGKVGSGDRIFARNFDYSSAIPMVVKTNPSKGYKSISTVNLEFIGYSAENLPTASDRDSLLPLAAVPYMPLDGVNERGLAIGVLQINWYAAIQEDESKVSLPTTTMIRMILDKAATVDEALAMMRKYNIADSLGSNFHYQIADKTGKSVVVEYVYNPVFDYVDMIVVEQGQNEDYQCAENFLLSHMGAFIQSQAYPAGIGAKARYGILRETLEENGGAFADMEEAMKLLDKADQGERTHWSVVYNLNKASSLFVAKTQHDKPLSFAI